MISLIWAMDENRLVGKDQKLPWHYKEDLLYFKSKTKNQKVLMGDTTYHSLKGYYKDKPLPFGQMFVCSINHCDYEDAQCVTDLVKFVSTFKDDLWVIGGKSIYIQTLPFANRLFITYILNKHEGNVFFPKIDISDFRLKWYETSEKLIFSMYERR